MFLFVLPVLVVVTAGIDAVANERFIYLVVAFLSPMVVVVASFLLAPLLFSVHAPYAPGAATRSANAVREAAAG